MNKILYTAGFVVVIILTACTKDTITMDADNDIPVIEAFLQPGQPISVQLTKMLPYTEDEYTELLSIDTAQVHMTYKGIDYLLTHVSGSGGKYESVDSGLVAVTGGLYNLFFDYNGNMVSSTTFIPSEPVNIASSSSTLQIDPNENGPGSTKDPMSISWDNSDNSYHLVLVEYLEATYDPISENLSTDQFDQFRKVSTDPVQETSLDLDTRRHLVFFGTYRVIVYQVNEEYVNLYENISQNSLNLTEPLTNIKNGLGIFTGMNSDTIFIEVEEI